MDVKIILKSYLQKQKVNIFCQGFSVSTTFSFKSMENKHDTYRDKDSMKKFYESLREHRIEIFIFKKKKQIKF